MYESFSLDFLADDFSLNRAQFSARSLAFSLIVSDELGWFSHSWTASAFNASTYFFLRIDRK